MHLLYIEVGRMAIQITPSPRNTLRVLKTLRVFQGPAVRMGNDLELSDLVTDWNAEKTRPLFLEFFGVAFHVLCFKELNERSKDHIIK